MSPRHLPPPKNGDYRGPVLVQPARPALGVDLADVANRERRERWQGDVPETRGSAWSRRVEWLAIAAVLLALTTIIIPGAAWLLDGAEQVGRADASLTGADDADRVAP